VSQQRTDYISPSHMKLEIYTFSFNEAHILPHFVMHYRTIDPHCLINIFDNESTDRTREIAESMGCNIHVFDTGGRRSDVAMSALKNSCWKASTADWVVVCDCDEFLHISRRSLATEVRKGASILSIHGFEVVGAKGFPLTRIGSYPSIWYCKSICFRPSEISDINYTIGAHHCSPSGNVVFSRSHYRLDHFRYISYRLLLKKHLRHFHRRNLEEAASGYGVGYQVYDYSVISSNYRSALKNSFRWRLFQILFSFYAYSLWLKIFKT
jgi:glycosyltransferase involved in cell wall biosynthesis